MVRLEKKVIRARDHTTIAVATRDYITLKECVISNEDLPTLINALSCYKQHKVFVKEEDTGNGS